MSSITYSPRTGGGNPSLADIEREILENLVEKYEKKGGGETSASVTTIYRRYNEISEPVQKTEWFESAARMLQDKGLVETVWKDGRITRFRLVISEAGRFPEVIGREISLKQDGRSVLKNDNLHALIDTSYYMLHPSDYLKEREAVLSLSAFLAEHDPRSMPAVSEKERCFQIWREEKMFYAGGRNVLKHCGIDEAVLNTYKTYEPVPYMSFTDKVPQNILFVENSATYGSILMMKRDGEGGAVVCGKVFGTIVYGGGDRILGQIEGWKVPYVPEYLTDDRNEYYYFGDLDRCGIQIFMGLERAAPFPVSPLREAYVRMAEKMEGYLKDSGDGKMMPVKQKKVSVSGFDKYFSEDEWRTMEDLLRRGYLVPQEILTAEDL